MELKVTKYDKEGKNPTVETTKLDGTKDFTPEKDWREFNGKLVDREEKTITFKNGNLGHQFIYQDEMDDRGTNLHLETWSTTDDAILKQLMDEGKPVHMYYEMKTNDYGTKFNIKAIELPDGSWSVAKAKEAWKKGNQANNRALTLGAAATLVAPTLTGNEAPLEIAEKTTEVADMLLSWVEQTAK